SHAYPQINKAAIAEALHGLSVARVQRKQPAVQSAKKDALLFSQSRKRHAAIDKEIVGFVFIELRIEGPSFFSRFGIERNHATERRRRVPPPVHDARRALKRGTQGINRPAAQVAGVIRPGALEPLNIAPIDLREWRISRPARTAAVKRPFLRERNFCRKQA